MQAEVDQVKPGAKWEFDHEVTRVFDNMLSRSIPDHDEMRRLVFDLGRRFVRDGSDVLDLGCSRGAALAPFVDQFGSRIRCVGLDQSAPMVDASRERFRHAIKAGIVDIRNHDLRDGLPQFFTLSVTLAVLTLQFVPIEYRQRVVADVYRQTQPGGAFIVVEKVLADDAATDRLYVDAYYGLKKEHGYTEEQIDAKRRSLEGVLVPLTSAGNEQLLRAEGFSVSRFWQWCNFAGWLAVKPKAGPR